jgi:hypothetical protein
VVELQQQVEDAWDSIPLRTIQTLIDSMPRRIAEVIAARVDIQGTSTGAFLMYWGLVTIFLHASVNHCFGVFFVAKSTVQRFMPVCVQRYRSTITPSFYLLYHQQVAHRVTLQFLSPYTYCITNHLLTELHYCICQYVAEQQHPSFYLHSFPVFLCNGPYMDILPNIDHTRLNYNRVKGLEPLRITEMGLFISDNLDFNSNLNCSCNDSVIA